MNRRTCSPAKRVSPGGAIIWKVWAWEELNLRPHAYELAGYFSQV